MIMIGEVDIMKEFFGNCINESESGFITAEEISQQPFLWEQVLEIFIDKKEDFKKYLFNKLEDKDLRIIFTGAGTSAYIGEVLVPYLLYKKNIFSEYIPTTDLVTSPEKYLLREKSTLLISFGRSGNSPESIAAIDIAESYIDDLFNIIITCNNEGELYKRFKNSEKDLTILMPEKSNDRGFAMTGSFSSMLLSAMILFDIDNFELYKKDINLISKRAEKIIEEDYKKIKNICNFKSNRVVFLGSDILKGFIRETRLKVLELTSGQKESSFETFLGFRHGPKSILNEETDIFFYLNVDDFTNKYEIDLIDEIKSQNNYKNILICDPKGFKNIKDYTEFYFDFSDIYEDLNIKELIYFDYLVLAQIYAFISSVLLEINPDNPSPNGQVNRVVKGVKIYK
jgi:tagatose-6-phosphate ketose/aldose isomerase